jgi:hypothetical protein
MAARKRLRVVQFGAAFFLLTLYAPAQVAMGGATATRCNETSPAIATCWHKLDAGPFSILAPLGWKFRQLMGVDSYVGEFVGDGIALTFDFGRYSTELRKAKNPASIITKESIGGLSAKVVSPRTAGNGITGVYFRKIPATMSFVFGGRT